MNELHFWLSGQHPGLKTFKALQLKLDQLAADRPEQRAMCRLLHGIVGRYVEEFDEAPLPSDDRRSRLSAAASIAGGTRSAQPNRPCSLVHLNRLAALNLAQ